MAGPYLALLLAATLGSCAEAEVSVQQPPQPPPPPVSDEPGRLPPGRGYILARVRENVLAYIESLPDTAPPSAVTGGDAERGRGAHELRSG